MHINHVVAKGLIAAALFGGAGVGLVIAADSPAVRTGTSATAAGTTYQGITVPKDRRNLTLKVADVVREVKVKPMDKVTVGQLLLSEDTREEEFNLQIIEAEVKSQVGVKVAQATVDAAKVAVRAAVTTRDSKKVEYQRYLDMGTSAQPQEVLKAKLDLDLAEIDIEKANKDVVRAEKDLEKAQVEQEQKALQAKRQATTIERMQIRSTVNGIVEDVIVHEGEVIDPQKPAAIIVDDLDTLWAEVYLPSQVTLGLHVGQPMTLVYTGLPNQPRVEGKLVYMNPMVDAAADKRLVRVEVDNSKDQRMAGLAVDLIVPDATAKADSK